MAVAQLGYLGFEVRDLLAWAHFAEHVLGLTVTQGADGLLLRMDSAAYRFRITEGPLDDVACVGWLVDDEPSALVVVGRLKAAGVAVERATAADAAARQVGGFFRFVAPGDYASELAWGFPAQAAPFASNVVASRFLADELGLGHCVLTVPDRAAAAAFYTETLGLKLSDTIVTTYFGLDLELQFFHTPSRDGAARHHSLALSEPIEGVPNQKRCNHFMLEVEALEDVGRAFDRTVAAGLPIAQTLGRHPNDRMLSFYALTPSGFQFEFGWGGRLVDDADWEPTTYDRLSDWGHHPPVTLVPRRGKK